MSPTPLPFPQPGDELTVARPGDTADAESPADGLRARALQVVECTIPGDMTIAQWRLHRSTRAAPAHKRWSRALAAVTLLRSRREVPCDHLHDSTTRYDRTAKRLDFLLVCQNCGIEKLIHSLPYEPRFEPAGATVHRFQRPEPLPRACRAA